MVLCIKVSLALNISIDISNCDAVYLSGKVWFTVMIFLRFLILLFAGYPLYQDEQERFVCNTIQPGCANVCYDLFSPISHFRFWLVQLVTLCLPYLFFIIYVAHKVSNGLTVDLSSTGPIKVMQLYKIKQKLLSKTSVKKMSLRAEGGWARCFTGAYILHLMFRTLLEAGFGAAQYFLFGFYIPRRFLCQHPPCTTQVDCYISRPTEKTVMLNFMLGVAALSLFLNVLDFICAIKRSVRQKCRRKYTVESEYEVELSAEGATDPNTQTQHDLESEAGQTGSFRKRRGSKGSSRVQEAPCLERPSLPCSPGPTSYNTNGNNGCSTSQDEAPERDGSELTLCPLDPVGTPRSIRVSKRGRLKPPPPPRRDLGLHPGVPAGPSGDNPSANAACPRRVGQYTLVELGNCAELQTNDEGAEKRSEWVWLLTVSPGYFAT